MKTAEVIERAVEILKGMKAGDCAKLMLQCVDPDPDKRPRNYAAVLKQIHAGKIPREAKNIWQRLRAPYARRLAELGLNL